MSSNAPAAIEFAIEFYANSLGVTVAEAVELYKNHESTQQCIQLLVLAQADKEGLRKMAASM